MRFKDKAVIILQGRADKKIQEEGEKVIQPRTNPLGNVGCCWSTSQAGFLLLQITQAVLSPVPCLVHLLNSSKLNHKISVSIKYILV